LRRNPKAAGNCMTFLICFPPVGQYRAVSFQSGLNKERSLVMKKYVCEVCGWVYDPETGVPEAGIAPGTAFEDLPDDFECPECGVGKDQFSEV